MTTVTNFEISSADESCAENVTSQINIDLKSATQAASNSPAKKYQRTRSYDEAYFSRMNKKLTPAPNDQQQPAQNFTTRVPEANPNPAPIYYGPPGPESMPNFEYYRRPYDLYYGSGYLYPQPFLYPSSTAYDPMYTNQYPDPLVTQPLTSTKPNTLAYISHQRQRQFETMYRSTPLLNYGSNSYFGWHQRPPAPIYRPVVTQNQSAAAPQSVNTSTSTSCLDADLLVSTYPNGKTQSCTPEITNPGGSVLFDKETVSPFFNDSKAGRIRTQRRRGHGKCSPTASLCAASLGESSLTSAAVRRNRVKLCIIMSILVIIVAVLVAMGIAVYSQVKSQNSLMKLVRQYRSSFIITGGRQLDYDADLLNIQSHSFKHKAKEFERKIDSIFRDSGLASIYEGVEVISFRFVVEPPGMEVQFNLKTKVSVQLQVADLLAILDDAIRHNINGIFHDSVIDLKSITVESQRLPVASVRP